ncbi:hypothetical protein BOQ62_02630 [Chryseobacterium sp. CH21]|uniref:hypothetical protein n=1 Tax=Chryseobacterium sp. CH21 TaxID=713556 RepID=UPI00100AE2F9|nr:hypothetical protein [Chryseobacterium sp. CH21]RXM40957.1 hypothetical protein BOQ62_02630 [Chryseobacterium sp. CH21]
MYDWTEKGNYVFEFFTDNHDVYYLYLKPKEDHFADFCSECKDIYEVDLKCVSGKPTPDERVKETVIAILKQVLTERCQSLVFFVITKEEKRNVGKYFLIDGMKQKMRLTRKYKDL